MILDIENIRGFVNLPVYKFSWNKQFHHHILTYNKQHRKEINQLNRFVKGKKNQDLLIQLIKKSKKCNTNSQKQLNMQNCNNNNIINLKDDFKNVHTFYNNFVPLKNRQYNDKNQCERQFPYLAYISQNSYKSRQQQFQSFVRQNITKNKYFRKDLCQNYHPPINFTAAINLYKNVLSYGTKVLNGFKNYYSILYLLSQCQNYLPNTTNKQVKKNISLTIQKSQTINVNTISYTMKSLYCPLCFIYDCPVHENQHLTMGNELNTQSVSQKNKKQISQHLNHAMKMLNLLSIQKNENNLCSDQCYLKFEGLSKDPKFILYLINKQSIMSDLTKSVIELGVYLFSYEPCLIKNLFPHGQIMCCQIYKYLQTQLNIQFRVFNKMYQKQHEMLLNQQIQQKIPVHKQILQHKRKKHIKTNKKVNNSKQKQTDKFSDSISICVHHFTNQPSFDQTCQNCICKIRGYCMPSCLCSQNCKIMMIGCKCKKNKNSSCMTNACPCYSSGIQCIPEVCNKNCWQGDNCCMNRQIQMRKSKNVKIGISMIPQAGLGLYVVQQVQKDHLVTLYLGEKVDQLTIQLRDRLRKNDSFYNFQQNNKNIDSRFIGNKSRFINHNNPKQINLRVRIVKSLGQNWIAFYATRNIQPHEQLYFDYDGDGQISKHHAEKYPFIMPK